METAKVTVYLPFYLYRDVQDLAGMKHTSVSKEIAEMVDVRMQDIRPRLDAYRYNVEDILNEF